MIVVDNILEYVRDCWVAWCNLRTAEEGNRDLDAESRKRVREAVVENQNRERAAVAAGDTQIITAITDDSVQTAPNTTVPGYQEQAQAAKKEVEKKDAEAMKRRLEGLILGICCLTLAGCLTTAPAPVIPAAQTWSVKIITVEGQEGVWVPKAVYSRMLDRLIYLKELEENGKIVQ